MEMISGYFRVQFMSEHGPFRNRSYYQPSIPWHLVYLVTSRLERVPYTKKKKTLGTQSLVPGVLFKSLALNFFRICRQLQHQLSGKVDDLCRHREIHSPRN